MIFEKLNTTLRDQYTPVSRYLAAGSLPKVTGLYLESCPAKISSTSDAFSSVTLVARAWWPSAAHNNHRKQMRSSTSYCLLDKPDTTKRDVGAAPNH